MDLPYFNHALAHYKLPVGAFSLHMIFYNPKINIKNDFSTIP